MIVFELICKEQHRFEGWFASGEDFTSQQSRGLLNCPVCGGAHVVKLPTAKIRKQATDAVPAEPESTVAQGQANEMDIARAIDFILTHSEDVGRRFAEEARRIYYQKTPNRSIRGVATPSETEELKEEGVPVFSLPIPPQDRWN